MSKSVLYAVNSNTQPTLDTGSVINFGSVIRRYGNNLKLSDNNVTINGVGYYDIDTNFTITPLSNGTLTIRLFKDGVAIPGAVATISTTGSTIAISIPAIVRETCCCEESITVLFSGVATNVTNAAIAVTKL